MGNFIKDIEEKIPAGMGNMIVMLPALYLSNNIDFKDNEQNLMLLRISFAVSLLLTILAAFYVQLKIKGTPNNEEVTVEPVSPGFGQPPQGEAETMTAQEYDLRECKKIINQCCMSFGVPCFLHYKWEMVPPLVIQTVLAPKTVLSSPLFAHYILGDPDIVRPFPVAPNPLQQLMNGGATEPAAAPAAATPSPAAKTGPKKKKSVKAD